MSSLVEIRIYTKVVPQARALSGHRGRELPLVANNVENISTVDVDGNRKL